MKKQLQLLCCLLFIASFPTSIFAQRLNEEDLAKKKEGWYPTGLPLLSFNSDNGFGYGALVYMYFNGNREDKYFDMTPYFMKLYVSYFATTKGIRKYTISIDFPYVMGSKFRLKAALRYERAQNANYFGIGADAAKAKLTDNTGNTYSKYKDYYDNFLNMYKSYYKWNNYNSTQPQSWIYIYRNLTDEIKILGGFKFIKTDVDFWDGRRHNDNLQLGTLLSREQPRGYKGGWSNFARVGVAYDTRDFEPDPKNGVFIDYAFEVSGCSVGSDYNFNRSTAAARFYKALISSLVLALRIAYTDANKNIPFYEMNYFGFALERRTGLGGNKTLHGFKKDRFVGKTMTMGNAELRWQFFEVTGVGQRFGFKLVGFTDTGNVYDRAGDPFSKPCWGDYHHSYGGGLVIAWNLATLIHVYYGRSKEDTGLFIDFYHNF